MRENSCFTRVTSGIVVALLLGTGLPLAGSGPVAYGIEDLGTLGAPDECENGLFPTWSAGFGLNESGDVAGWAERSEWLLDPDTGEPLVYPDTGLAVCERVVRAVLWRDGEVIPLGSLSDHEVGFGIRVNNHDQVVGWAMQRRPDGAGYHGHPYLWTEGVGMIDVAPDFGPGTAWGINDFGEVAMRVFSGDEPGGAYFRDRNGVLHHIVVDDPVDLGEGDAAWEVNNEGVVVGAAHRENAGGARHAFRYDSTANVVDDIHDPFFSTSEAFGVNENGDAAGWAFGYLSRVFGFVSPTDGEVVVLPLGNMVIDGELRWDLEVSLAEHMNDRGDVVGADDSEFSEPVAWVVFEALGEGTLQKVSLWELLAPEDREDWEPIRAYQINEARQIVGIGRHDGRIRAFLMTPDDSAANGDTGSATAAVPAPGGEPVVAIRSGIDPLTGLRGVTNFVPDEMGSGRVVGSLRPRFAIERDGTSIEESMAPISGANGRTLRASRRALELPTRDANPGEDDDR